MGFDFSALDAELDDLGGAPSDAQKLADRFAGRLEALDDVDEELAQLDLAARTLGATPRKQVEALAIPRRAEAAPVIAAAPAPVLAAVAPVAAAPEPEVEEPAHEPPPKEEPRFEQQLESAPAHATLSDAPAYEQSFEDEEEDAEVDAAIASLGSEWPAAGEEAPPQVFEEPAPREAVPLTQSQEIVLPDPIPREELSHESGELRLDGEAPSSGSFSLPEPASEEPRDALSALVDDDVQDALEGSQPIALRTHSRPVAAPIDMDRDPDAEFDALLSEATDPRGMPTTSGDFDAEELLRGLDAEEANDKPSFPDTLQIGSSAVASFDEPEPEGDSTEVLDRETAFAMQSIQEELNSRGELAIESDELDDDELEIVMDDDDSDTIAPPVVPPTVSKVPPPPPPMPGGGPDKRPSLLGRIFNGKRED